MMFKLSSKFYEYLKFRGWQQKEFAKHLGYSEPFISMILHSERGLSANFMERLKRLTNLSLDELFEVSDEQIKPDYQFEKRADLSNEAH